MSSLKPSILLDRINKMSQTSITGFTVKKKFKSKANAVASSSRRYSDYNIVLLEDRDKFNTEEEKLKLIKRRDEQLETFKKTYLLDEQGELKANIKTKKFTDQSKYIGEVNEKG